MAEGGDFSRSVVTRSMKRQKTSKNNLDAPKPYSSKLQQLVADADRVNNELNETNVGERSHYVQMLKTKKVRLLKEIDKLRKEMNGHLDHLERKAKAELDEEIAKLEQEEHGDATTVTNLLTTTNARNTELECNIDDKYKLIPEQLYQNDVSASNAFLSNTNPPNEDVLTFERNTHLYDCVIGADHLGKIVRKKSTLRIAKRSKYVVKSSSERNIRVANDRTDCYIRGMCQLQDGTILITDYDNEKLKRLDDQLKVKDYCNLQSSPSGICSISPTEVVVRYSESMQFIHVGESLSPGKVVNMKKLGFRYSIYIALCDGMLWTTGVRCLHVYTTSGKLVKTIDKDCKGQKILSNNSVGITVHPDGSRVYVTQRDDSVVVFNKDGDLIQKIRDHRMDQTCGICVTEDDIVLVTAFSSNNVVMFDREGNNIGELVASKEMLPCIPRALCYDRRKCRLLVGYDSNSIKVYELGE